MFIPDRIAEDQLRRLLQSRALHPYQFCARCEIGPFVVAHVCPERSLVVELLAKAEQRQRQRQRAAFLRELGYDVLEICPSELQRHPRRALRRVRAALRLRVGTDEAGNRASRHGI
jgi:very-short-patch-repair endonuclease